jgi:signal transduction histidine kinase
MNQPAEKLLNTQFSKVAGQSIDFVFKNKFKWDEVTEILDKGKNYSFDFESETDNLGHPLIMRARSSGIYDKEGTRTGIVTIIHDVTHEREVDRLKTEFISTAAHEFRTPLTSIQGFSEILLTRDDLSTAERKKFMSYINKQALSLASIVSDLLDVSRIEAETGFALNKTPCKIGEAIHHTVQFFQEQSPKHHFEVVVPEDPDEVFVDKEKMLQVLKNIISNAVKYSPDGGVIRVTIDTAGSFCKVTVEDQGIGMKPEQVAKIFDKFYRVDASDSAVEGTGLGMTIVKHIVEAHGGQIYVESKLGKGTKVTYEIPKQDPAINNNS